MSRVAPASTTVGASRVDGRRVERRANGARDAVRARSSGRAESVEAASMGECRVDRRRALALVVASGVAFVGASRAGAEEETRAVVIEAVANERWVAVDATIRAPASWGNRPGQRARREKFVLYTDTYGPNYRYTTSLPKFVRDGETMAEAAALVVQSKEGLESIEDLGTPNKIDPARAFGVELDGLVAADVKKSSTRTQGTQKYYEWELNDGTHTFLLSACVSGGGLYAFVLEVDAAKFAADAQTYRDVLTSLDIPRVEESRNDMSSRIYENR